MIETAEQAAQAEDLLVRIREASARAHEAHQFRDDNDDPIAQQAYRERLAELRGFKAQIPHPPRSFADIVALAEIASHEDMNEREVDMLINAQCKRCIRVGVEFVALLTAILQFAEACEAKNSPGH
jgi:hypothetical protein